MLNKIILLIIIYFSVHGCDSPQQPKKDNIPPSAIILHPPSGHIVSEIALIQIRADDDNGINTVELLVNDNAIYEAEKSDSIFIAYWNTTTYQNDQYLVQAKVIDLDKNSTISDSIFLFVDNSLSSPQPQNITSIHYDHSKMTINWDSSLETDLLAYEILISDSYNGFKTSFAYIYDSTATPHLITNDYNPAEEKYYWLKVIDSFFYFSIGNGYRLMDDYPKPSSLFPIVEEDSLIFFVWTTNRDSDFVSYSLNMSDYENMDYNVDIFSSTSRMDTIFSLPRITSKHYFNIEVKDYWGLETPGNIQIMDLGVAPIINSISIPDTINIPEFGQDTLYSVNTNVTDEDGLDNISTVMFKSFLNQTDSIIHDTIYVFLYDDGGLNIIDSSFSSGDIEHGDGVYSCQVLIDSSIKTGVYSWIFSATDLDQRISNTKEATVVVQ